MTIDVSAFYLSKHTVTAARQRNRCSLRTWSWPKRIYAISIRPAMVETARATPERRLIGMHTFCTYFDANYLDRGLCLWRSLRDVSPDVRLFVCCLDDKVFDVLTSMNIAGVTPLRLRDVEDQYPSLAAAKSTRSKIEYYFTITPSLVRFIFDTRDDVSELTYVDSDLLFFSDPQPLFDEMDHKAGSVALIAHRFTPHLDHLKIHGIYNVGWLTFKRTKAGMACLADWQQKCNDWCYDRVEGDRFADQKYLDAWSANHQGVIVLDHPGANVALWNLQPDTIKPHGESLKLFGQPLIFYHFHGLSQIKRRVFFTSARVYAVRLDTIVKNRVYGRYMSNLRRIQRELRSADIHPLIRYKHSSDDIAFARNNPAFGAFLVSVLGLGVPPWPVMWRWLVPR